MVRRRKKKKMMMMMMEEKDGVRERERRVFVIQVAENDFIQPETIECVDT